MAFGPEKVLAPAFTLTSCCDGSDFNAPAAANSVELGWGSWLGATGSAMIEADGRWIGGCHIPMDRDRMEFFNNSLTATLLLMGRMYPCLAKDPPCTTHDDING